MKNGDVFAFYQHQTNRAGQPWIEPKRSQLAEALQVQPDAIKMAQALDRSDVRREYEEIKEEFEILDDLLKARAEAGLTQAELAARIGTTQSAVARLETQWGSTPRQLEL